MHAYKKGCARYMETLEPAYHVPSRKTVTKELHVMESDIKAHVLADLERGKYVSLTADFWTSLANDPTGS